MKPYLVIFLGVIIWAFEYILIKKLSFFLNPLTIGFFIFTVSTISLGLFVLINKSARPKEKGENGNGDGRLKSRLFYILLISIVINLFLLFGQRGTSPINSSSLGRTDVMFTYLLSILFFHQTVGLDKIIVSILMLAGIYLVIGIRISEFYFGNTGDYLILGSAFFMSINAFLIKQAMNKFSGFWIAFCNSVANTLFFLFADLFSGGLHELLKPISISDWILVFLCGGCNVGFFITYYYSLKHMPVFEVRLMCLLVPMFTILISWAVFGKLPSVFQFLGIFLLLCGAVLLIFLGRKENKDNSIKNMEA